MTELEKVKRAIKMLNVRASNRAVAVIPPIPVFGFCETPGKDGKIYGFILPADGKISRVCVHVESISANQFASFKVRMGNAIGVQETNFTTKKNFNVKEVDVNVKTGDFISVSVEDPTSVAGVSVSFLYHLEAKDSNKISLNYDALGIGDEGVLKALE